MSYIGVVKTMGSLETNQNTSKHTSSIRTFLGELPAVASAIICHRILFLNVKAAGTATVLQRTSASLYVVYGLRGRCSFLLWRQQWPLSSCSLTRPAELVAGMPRNSRDGSNIDPHNGQFLPHFMTIE